MPIPCEEEEEIDLGRATSYFVGLYERNRQISIVLSALEAARSSDFVNRFHVVLAGPPGSGKTTIASRMARVVGGEHVIRFDGPSSTRAGVENYFLDLAQRYAGRIPPKVLIFEELDKARKEIHQALLGILDDRGEIRKTSGTKGQQQCDVRVLCIATINDVAKFLKFERGALASRFRHKVECPAPSREALGTILLREIQQVGGDPTWVEPTLKHCVDLEGTRDSRRLLAVCLSGRERLLTGEYQTSLLKTHT